jgi:hypothetical protein
MQQRIVVLACDQRDVSAVAAIAAARAAARHKLLAPESHAAISAVTGLHGNYYFVNKHS